MKKTLILSEWFSRASGASFNIDLSFLKKENIWSIQWGLVNGRTQTQYPWWNKPGDGIDKTGWFHDLLHRDGPAYRPKEIENIKRIIAQP